MGVEGATRLVAPAARRKVEVSTIVGGNMCLIDGSMAVHMIGSYDAVAAAFNVGNLTAFERHFRQQVKFIKGFVTRFNAGMVYIFDGKRHDAKVANAQRASKRAKLQARQDDPDAPPLTKTQVKQLFSITSDVLLVAVNVLRSEGMKYMVCVREAEHQIAWMVQQGMADVVWGYDFDYFIVLARAWAGRTGPVEKRKDVTLIYASSFNGIADKVFSIKQLALGHAVVERQPAVLTPEPVASVNVLLEFIAGHQKLPLADILMLCALAGCDYCKVPGLAIGGVVKAIRAVQEEVPTLCESVDELRRKVFDKLVESAHVGKGGGKEGHTGPVSGCPTGNEPHV